MTDRSHHPRDTTYARARHTRVLLECKPGRVVVLELILSGVTCAARGMAGAPTRLTPRRPRPRDCRSAETFGRSSSFVGGFEYEKKQLDDSARCLFNVRSVSFRLGSCTRSNRGALTRHTRDALRARTIGIDRFDSVVTLRFGFKTNVYRS